MRHHNANRKFGRTRDARKALLRSLARSLVLNGKISTTEAKAKELRPFVEKLVTRAKNPTLATNRLLRARIGSVEAALKLSKEIAPKYQSRPGGYIRIAKTGLRRKDGSVRAIIEFV